ncbi:hypothetical protein IG631_19448 [Alternaria alternata]|nr:hypothetical protein IG631_19448 [Alternaria alternata]
MTSKLATVFRTYMLRSGVENHPDHPRGQHTHSEWQKAFLVFQTSGPGGCKRHVIGSS